MSMGSPSGVLPLIGFDQIQTPYKSDLKETYLGARVDGGAYSEAVRAV
jgi:hypothetical protein